MSETTCLVENAKLTKKRGTVATIRRRQIAGKINESMGRKLVWASIGFLVCTDGLTIRVRMCAKCDDLAFCTQARHPA